MKLKKTILYLMAAATTILSGCSSKNEETDIIRPVKTGKAAISSTIEETVISGTVSAGTEAHPAFRIYGVVEKVYVKEGQYVEQGDLIAELDTRDAQEIADAAKGKYDQVTSEVARVEELYKRQSVAKNEYEKAISGRQSVTSLYNTAQNNLKDSKLYAPISGIVQSVNCGPNQTVTPANSVVNIVNTNTLNIECYISSSLYVKQNKFVKFEAKSALFPDTIPLVATYISPKANNNQLYKVKFNIDSKFEHKLAPGMVVEIKLYYISDTGNELTVPFGAIFAYKGESHLWCVDTTNMTVHRKQIKTKGTSRNGDVIVTEGISGEEIIVTAGVSKLTEGDKVRIMQPASKSNAGALL